MSFTKAYTCHSANHNHPNSNVIGRKKIIVVDSVGVLCIICIARDSVDSLTVCLELI